MARVTMKDVAQVVGVSTMTVSNAFNRPDQLSADLRERILGRAAKMGYSGPDATARHLRSGRTNTFGVIFKEKLSYAFADPFTATWLTAFSQVMEDRQASILLLSVPAGDEGARDTVQNSSMDGVAGLCSDTDGIRHARERGLPTVVSSVRVPIAEATEDCVVIDDYAAGADAARHLRGLGHRHIDVLLYEKLLDADRPIYPLPDLMALMKRTESSDYLDLWPRLRGIVDHLQGCDVRVVMAAHNSHDSGQESASLILDRATPPTAVLALSDMIAGGFLQGCRDRSLRPGPDVSVLGFDDLPEAAALGLTTIAQPIADKGRLSAELLLDRERPDRQIVLPHHLKVRASTRPAPTR